MSPRNTCFSTQAEAQDVLFADVASSHNHSIILLAIIILFGPLLFLIYINDLNNCTVSTPRLFADDTAILVDASSPTELQVKVNQELARIYTWMLKNKLTVNPLKSHALVVPPVLSEIRQQ